MGLGWRTDSTVLQTRWFAHVCESLASASVMTSDIAAYVDAPQRHTLLAIQQVIMLAELAVNRVLDNGDIPKPTPHSCSHS